MHSPGSMRKRQQDARKVEFCLLKLFLVCLPLIPHLFGRFIDLVQEPLEVTRYFTLLILMLDVFAFRYLFLEDLSLRKGQAAFVTVKAAWSLPNAGLYILGSVFVFAVAIVLFGAPILDAWLETLHLALILSVMSFGPFALSFGQPVDECLKFIQTIETDMSMDKASLVPGLAGVIGAWCGAVVIPLDWDRPWQKWPIPCCYGAFAGYAVGYIGWLIAILWKSLRRPGVHRSQSKVEKFVE